MPTQFRGKRPLVKWTEWRDRTAPEFLMRAWFKGQVNMALVLGKGLTVLDFDDKEEYKRWREANPTLAQTLTHTSGRGVHPYFWSDASKTYRMQGGEVKASGLITVPPSVHGNGKAYQVVEDREILRVDSVHDLGVLIEVKPEYTYVEDVLVKPTLGGTTVERIKANFSLVEFMMSLGDVQMRNRKLWMMCCPFHNDKNPSMAIYAQEDVCYCFATQCKAHKRMDIIDCAALLWGVSVGEAIRTLAQRLDCV